MTLSPACSDNEEENGPSCPVECSVPATAEIGSKMTIAGQGFAATAEVGLRNSAGTETRLENPEITAAGFTGLVPATLTPGSYTVVLHQDGTWELGTVTLTAAAECPVLSITVPDAIRLNQALEIAGAGFSSDMGIVLENTANQSRTELTAALSSTGVSCTIPDGVSAGTYNVILTQDSHEWIIAESVPAAVYKRLKSVSLSVTTEYEGATVEALAEYLYESSQGTDMPMDEATALSTAQLYFGMGAFEPTSTTSAYTFSFDADGNPTSSTGKGLYDEAASEWFTFTVDNSQLKGTNQQFEEGTDGIRTFAWTMDNGRIAESTISYENRDARYLWAYDAQGFWTGVNNPDGSPYMALAYDAAKFTGSTGNAMFTYTASPQLNSIFGVDIAKMIFGLQTINIIEVDQLAAILLNLAGTPSTTLPATILEMDGSTPTPTYQFDEDGYVSKIDWSVTGGKDMFFQLFDSNSKTSYVLVYE